MDVVSKCACARDNKGNYNIHNFTQIKTASQFLLAKAVSVLPHHTYIIIKYSWFTILSISKTIPQIISTNFVDIIFCIATKFVDIICGISCLAVTAKL